MKKLLFNTNISAFYFLQVTSLVFLRSPLLRAMTKLLEWVSAASAVFAIWYSLIAGYVKHPLIEKNMNLILVSPIIFVILFGLYAVTVILYRVFTFNDCEEAAKELQEEIIQAKRELKEKGFQW